MGSRGSKKEPQEKRPSEKEVPSEKMSSEKEVPAEKMSSEKVPSEKVSSEKEVSSEKLSSTKPTETSHVKEAPKAKPKKVKRHTDGNWQDANLSDLMEGLELKDHPHVWEDYIDSLIARSESTIVPERERKGWKTVRLFVSSTFKDMSNERDYLVKQVFPQLRQWCEERKLRLIECDLRWGVPKDADTRETLMACLSEIDRCREENIHPYFLNLMSERYGWVPKIEEIPDDIRIKYKWMPGMSVTTSEIMVGGYWDRNKHAMFLFRTPEYLDHVQDEKIKSYLVEKNEDNRQSLQTLKKKIRDNYPDQCYDYSCKYEREAEGKIHLGGFDAMGERVLNHFKMMLDQQYPSDSLALEPSKREVLKMEHETFMVQRSHVLLGREDGVKAVTSYIDSKDSEVPLALVGFPGSGKSSLIAYTVKQNCKNKKFKVFYHFIGATPGSTDLFQILQRFFLEFMPESTKMPEDLLEMKRYAKTMFEYAAKIAMKEGFERIVVFLDALNQMDDDGDAQYLGWLPKQMPEGMRIIVSTLEGKCLNVLRGNDNDTKRSVELAVDPLDKTIRKDIVRKILADYNKKLDEEQLEILTSKPDSGRPLWLTIACEELRVFGEFRKLTQKIRDLPDDLTGILEMVLQRIVKEYGGDLVQATLCLVETSRFGLLETELLDLLAIQPSCPSAKNVADLSYEGKLPMAKWALVYVGLRPFLRPCGSSGDGRLDFHHRTTSKAVRKLFLSDKTSTIWWHKRLISYFENCKDLERKSEELPYHLECAEDKEKLKVTLTSQEMFSQLYQESNKQQLMKYWRFIGGYDIAAETYRKGLLNYWKDKGIEDIDIKAPIQIKVAAFLIDIGEYTTASTLLKEVLEPLEVKHGHEYKGLSEPLFYMTTLLYRKALQYVYSSHPGYRECSSLGKEYTKHCLEASKTIGSENKQRYGNILLICGYFGGAGHLEEAKTIFENINDQQGLAQALYMLGEKNQYNNEMSIPTEMFTKSMTLCMSMFGKNHLHTARCAQLHGQMYWNRWTSNRNDDFLVTCLGLYKLELEILCEVQGDLHPNTVRSREDVIIILQSLRRDPEAEVFQAQQPKTHQAL